MSYQPQQTSGAAPAPSSSSGPQEEFTVRIPRDTRKRFTMMKFRSGTAVDFSKLGEQPVKMERENNLKEYKTANDLDLLPKFGAGSEYGRDQKEESRRKKYGIMLKKYNHEDQPWLLKIGSGKQAKRYKGVREGTITENTSYFIFTKASDGAFEAYPVEQWYNFSPMIRYKYLNSEEAEEEFSRRDKTLNQFAIMLKNKMKKDEDNADDEEETKAGKKSKKKSDMILTDMEEWDDMQLSDEDEREDDDDDKDGDGPKKKKKLKKDAKGKKKKNKQNSDDEAMEDSDEGDYDDREVDYMSDSGSESSVSGAEDKEKDKKYDEKGVDQEAGLRNILDSEGEEDEEEEAEKEDVEDETAEKESKKEEKKAGVGDDSSSSSSEDDSDIEKEAKLASELFLQDEKKEKKEKAEASSDSPTKPSTSSNSHADQLKAMKRKAEKTPDGKSPMLKKHKSDDNEGITEDVIRRYLMRKPMTTKDLFLKFKSKKLNMSNEKITHVIAQLLKKIQPDQSTINKKLYLSLKKPE